MAERKRSMQEIMRARQQAGFVGREGQLSQFRENLTLDPSDHRRRFIFNIYGDAGIGKTLLVNQFERSAREAGMATALANEALFTVPETMAHIAKILAKQGISFKDFMHRFDEYNQKRRELESDAHTSEGAADFLTQSAVKIGVGMVRDIPVAGAFVEAVDADALAEQANHFRAYLSGKLKNHDDVKLLLAPIDELTPIFLRAVNASTNNHGIALFFDTYERTESLLDGWIIDLLAGKYGELPDNLILTIAGQNRLSRNRWSACYDFIADVPLPLFNESEVKQLLARKGMADDASVGRALEATKGLPLLVAMFAEGAGQMRESTGDYSDDAVDRFLKWESDKRKRQAAILGSLPRFINQDIIEALAPDGDGAELFEWLSTQPFVARSADAWVYHNVVRDSMIRHQRGRSPQAWSELHATLMKKHAQWRRKIKESSSERWFNPAWRGHLLEETYHNLCADPEAALPKALQLAIGAMREGVEGARRWAAMVRQAGLDSDNLSIIEWGDRVIDSLEDDDQTKYLNVLIDSGHLDDTALSDALQVRAGIFEFTDRLQEALEDLDRALSIAPGDSRAWARRGTVYRGLKQYDLAIEDLTKAIRLRANYSWALAMRADVSALQGKFKVALVDINAAVKIQPKNHWYRETRAKVLDRLERPIEALTDLDRAIALDSSCHGVRELRGSIFNGLRRYEDALLDLDSAISMEANCVFSLGERGRAFAGLGQHLRAIDDFDRALDMGEDVHVLLERRGRSKFLLGRDREALVDLNRSLDLAEQCHSALELRGRCLQALGSFTDAMESFNRALSRRDSCSSAYAFRGTLFLDLHEYHAAIEDFEKAISLRNRNVFAYIGLGRAYRYLGDDERATLEFDKAIRIDAKAALAIDGLDGRVSRAIEAAKDH